MAKGNMVSFARTAEERMDSMMPSMLSDMPDSDMCICLRDHVLEKLDLADDPERGDILHLMVLVKVNGVHKDAGGVSINCEIVGGRVENEMHESADEEDEGEDE